MLVSIHTEHRKTSCDGIPVASRNRKCVHRSHRRLSIFGMHTKRFRSRGTIPPHRIRWLRHRYMGAVVVRDGIFRSVADQHLHQREHARAVHHKRCSGPQDTTIVQPSSWSFGGATEDLVRLDSRHSQHKPLGDTAGAVPVSGTIDGFGGECCHDTTVFGCEKKGRSPITRVAPPSTDGPSQLRP